MFEPYLLNHPWLVASIWLVLYSSDYYLTLYGAKLAAAQTVFQSDGSYELTPAYQKDIDSGNRKSVVFFRSLFVGALILLVPPLVAPDCHGWLYGLLVGYCVFVELVVHLRHFYSILTYRSVIGKAPLYSGRVFSTRRGTYQRSAQDLLGLGVLTLVCFSLTGSFVLLGGGLRVVREAFRHWRLSKACPLPSPEPEAVPDEAE